MYLGSSCETSAGIPGELLNTKAVKRDGEARLAATLRRTHGSTDAPAASENSPVDGERSQTARRLRDAIVAAEIVRAIEGRLPARIGNLQVDVNSDQFILRGVSGSYYIKQLAGHLAMTTLEAHILGRLVNEIEVHSVR